MNHKEIQQGRICASRLLQGIFLLMLLGSITMGCSDSVKSSQTIGGTTSKVKLALQDKSVSEDERVELILQSMTLTERLGQMMIVGIHGKEVNEDILYQLRQFHFGGVILFDRNMESLAQVHKLTGDLQSMSEEKVPLFIAIDEEGGDVVRMEDCLNPPPAQRELGLSGNPELAENSAVEISEKLRSIGINVNFAPVADIGDLGSAGSRYFSQDPYITADFVAAAANGYEKQGIYYSLKHFPGIGKGETDSHFDSVVIKMSKGELLKEDILPFKRIIDEHDIRNFFVMVSHSTYPEISGNAPAAFSSEIMSGLLRQELGFDGVILTDDLEMGAVAKYNGFRNMGVLAVEAGADVVMVCHDYEHETDVYMGLLEAVKDGKLSEERINESVRRVIRMKLRYLS